MRILFLLFLIVPIAEMLLLIEVGSFIGAFYTVLLVLLTAMIGVTLLKKQGLSTFMRANQKMHGGQMPVSEIGEGLMLAVAGALLLTPGFVTDTVGFLLLTPGIRQALSKQVAKKLVENSQQATFYSSTSYTHQSPSGNAERQSYSSGTYRNRAAHHDPDIIEGEFQNVSENMPEKDK